MMRRRKNPESLILLLALPIIGAVGWVASRLIGSQSAKRRQAIPVSRPRLPVNQPSSLGQEQREKTGEPASVDRPLGTGHKATGSETKVSQAGQKTEDIGHALENQPERLSTFLLLLIPFLILQIAIVLLAFYHIPVQSQAVVPGGDPRRGQVDLQAWGCGSCHTIKGVTGANGQVGPALNNISNRS